MVVAQTIPVYLPTCTVSCSPTSALKIRTVCLRERWGDWGLELGLGGIGTDKKSSAESRSL